MVVDQVNENFGIRARAKMCSLFPEKGHSREVAFNDTIVTSRKLSMTSGTRMCAFCRNVAVCRPPRMANADGPRMLNMVCPFFQCTSLPKAVRRASLSWINGGNANGVGAAIFQMLQAIIKMALACLRPA